MTVAIVLVASLCLGLGFVLQQRAAQEAPLADMLSYRLLLDLVRKPRWLLGIASMVAGQALGGWALGRADVTRVEPLLAANLLFAFALSSLLYRRRLKRREWLGAVLLSAGIAVFVIAGDPEGGAHVGAVQQWAIQAAIGVVALLLVFLAVRRPLPEKATLLAAAAGCLYGLQDGLTRDSLLLLDHGASALLVAWQPYIVVAIAITGIMLSQSAFETAPLKASLPAQSAAEPVVGIAFGLGVFGERLQTGVGPVTGEVGGLVAIVMGVLLLARSPALEEAVKEHVEHSQRGEGGP